MPETHILEDEPEPPRETLPDDAPATPPKRPTPWLYFAIGGMFFLALAGPLVFYFAVWRYRPTAPMHIPEGSVVAVRFDGRELYLYEPFREHVLDRLAGADQSGRARRLKKHTNVDLKRDVREIVFATATGETWVLLIGGHFGAQRGGGEFEDGLLEFLEGEKVSGFSVDKGAVVGRGVFIAQAEDTTVIIANKRETLDLALEPSDYYQRLGLASSGAMSFAIDRPAFASLQKLKPPKSAIQFLPDDLVSHAGDAFGHSQSMTGYVKFKRGEAQLFADIIPTPESDPESLSKEWEILQQDAAKLSDLIPEIFGLRSLVVDAKVKPRASSVMLQSSLDKAQLDAGLEELGAGMAAVFPEE